LTAGSRLLSWFLANSLPTNCIVSPTRHGVTQDVSETSNKQTNKQQIKTKENSKNREDFRDYAKTPNTAKTPINTAFK
jgi:hypothetical protein